MIDPQAILQLIREKAAAQQIRVTQHAQQEMTTEAILMDDVLRVLSIGQIIENYPDHRRGACCLLYGVDHANRNIHIVCTTANPMLIIITAYLPLPPKWITPTQRRTVP
jgi:Domain of unknown function (DUF4258)